MSVGTATELFLERSGSDNADGITTSRVFRVIATTSNEGPLEALAADDVPLVGDLHPSNNELWVTKRNAAPEANDGCHWKIKVDYELIPANQSDAGVQIWDRDPVVSTSFQSEQKVFERAYTYAQVIDTDVQVRNNPLIPVVNRPLWQWFDPPVMIDDFLLVIVVQRWIRESNFTAQDVYTYQNTLNSVEITIGGITIPALTGWLRDYKTQPNSERDQSSGSLVNYVAETIEIIVNPATWVKKIANMGVFKNAADSHYFTDFAKIEDEDGDAVRDPVRLDLNGQPLPDPGGGADNTVYLEYHGIWELAWAGLNLPPTYFTS